MTDKPSRNYVLHAKSKQFYWEGDGQLSIKTFRNGRAHYKTSKGFFAVDEGRYLLLNEGEYTISIEESEEVESFCIFFKHGFGEEILRTLADSTDRLLSDPYKEMASIGFFEKTYHSSPTLTFQLAALKEHLTILDPESIGYEEQFHQIMRTILLGHLDVRKEIDALHALRQSTREELYRRISIAHDYIRAFYDQPIRLDEIAQIACLSPNHLLRAYAQVYGKTPHQHISEYRIQRAKQLLAKLDFSMTDIAFEVGFSNPVSFSKMFKQHAGISPLSFRKKVILDKK
ncbi:MULTISPECIES: AraC family transcriptional regulator [Bacillales]|uniref:AraC family transcriptional regulator n=1 Tax=Bacillales TaxID=1385 RepID=UPI00034BA21B|nr:MULTISPECIES: AraC family transcriptional regulator [Bacillales]KMZ43588.1 AraC family transcriptional regulator [Bacillus sp. FJAT-27238]